MTIGRTAPVRPADGRTTGPRLAAVVVLACFVLVWSPIASAGAPAFDTAGADSAGSDATHAYGWGENNRGALATAGSARVLVPRAAVLPAGVSAVDGGSAHVLAVTSTGVVWAWGDNRFGQAGAASGDLARSPVRVPLPEPVTAIAAGADFSLALTESGAVYAWGRGENGQLGNGTTSVTGPTPVRVALPGAATAIAAGGTHGVAVLADGTVWSWGGNDAGQLGNGTRRGSATPVQALLPRGTDAVEVAAGRHHTVALARDGDLWRWGAPIGEGGPPAAPEVIPLPAGAVAAHLVSGDDFALVLTDAGQLLAWGDNDDGQLGDGSGADQVSLRQVPVPGPAPVVEVAAGARHALAITSAGDAWTWGDGYFGQAGDGTLDDHPTPAPVHALDGTEIIGVATGDHYSIVLIASAPPPTTGTTTTTATTATGTTTATTTTGTATTATTTPTTPATATTTTAPTTRTTPRTTVVVAPAGDGSGWLGYTGLAGWLIPAAAVLLGSGAALVALARRRARPAPTTGPHPTIGDSR